MPSLTEENYLKEIYLLLAKEKPGVSTNSIATRLKTKAASVTDMLGKLSKKKLINYIKYQGVTLTSSGEKTALGIIRKHRLWEMFLVEKLNFKWDEVHEVAEQLEHIKSEKLERELDLFLKFPKMDPHGDPIPDNNGKIHKLKSFPLTDMNISGKAIMLGVADHSNEFLQFLDSIGISPGKKLWVKKINLYDQSMQISTGKKKNLFISKDVAKNILVKEK